MRKSLQWEVWMSTKESNNDQPILSVSEPVVLDFGIHPLEIYCRFQMMMLDRLQQNPDLVHSQMTSEVDCRLALHLGRSKKYPAPVRFALLNPWLEIRSMCYGDYPWVNRQLVARMMSVVYPRYGLHPATALNLFELFLHTDPIALLKEGNIAAQGTTIIDSWLNDELFPVATMAGGTISIGLQSNCPFDLPKDFVFFNAAPDRYLCFIPK